MRNFQRPLVAKLASILLLCLVIPLASHAVATAQQKEKAAREAAPPPVLTRTTTKHEARRFGYGGTLTGIGAPAGSITIEAWNKREVDITADIELHAATEADL